MGATSLKEIARRIDQMKFKKRLFGGVDEEDVWKQIRQLDEDYQNLYKIQHQKYIATLNAMKQKNDKKAQNEK